MLRVAALAVLAVRVAQEVRVAQCGALAIPKELLRQERRTHPLRNPCHVDPLLILHWLLPLLVVVWAAH